MVGTTLDMKLIISPDSVATEISDKWRLWNQQRVGKLEEWKELRNYLFATDTRSTSNSSLPWKNSTTVPKLTQIRDNLHANYMATLFPQNKWMKWMASDKTSNAKIKRETIQAYMENKVQQSDFEIVMSKLVLDYIDYGNCFATVDWEANYTELENKEIIPGYIGPRVIRISPYDIVFNPVAADFKATPKIIRSLLSMGEVRRMVQEDPNKDYMEKVFSRMIGVRNAIQGYSDSDLHKNDGFVVDGFGSIREYYNSDYVEILTFYGDIYDKLTDTLMKNRIIKVIDRSYVLSDMANPSWLGKSPIYHVGWRERPDNLYAMGPLDNLVGLQYRMDHLENLRADVFDQIAFPVLKIKGDVEDFDFQPGTRIYLGDEGDVGYLSPDPTALNADNQIAVLENKMEQLAGAPREAMGIRTPGEKTAFEVSSLQNAASRIFQNKTQHFERIFVEPILNAMLEASRRNMDASDVIRVMDDELSVSIFQTITKEDITANGKIIPMGARHFAERAQRVQNLSQLWQLKSADPSVAAHLSGKEFARIMAEELGEKSLFASNISIYENYETQKVAQEVQLIADEENAIAMDEGI
tara:strand:- start:24649 stop:26397 length:1749 start_codon:yes stop_codon:yes gene_type:complete